jgi:hypothetical protein
MSCSFSPRARKESVNEIAAGKMKRKQVNRKRRSGTLECGELSLEGFDGSFRDSC